VIICLLSALLAQCFREHGRGSGSVEGSWLWSPVSLRSVPPSLWTCIIESSEYVASFALNVIILNGLECNLHRTAVYIDKRKRAQSTYVLIGFKYSNLLAFGLHSSCPHEIK